MTTLRGKRLLITGASRGIGEAIALRAARDGARIAIAAKSKRKHPVLPGTIYTAAEAIEAAGGEALPLVVDVRDEAMVSAAVDQVQEAWGGLDVLVNNASAIQLTGTVETPMKRFDLMHAVNVRGTYLMSQKCIPLLAEGNHPHILNISPPLNLDPRWFKNHVAYTMSKYGMSMCVLGMAEELRSKGIAVNALWPRTAIATAAIDMLGGKAFRSSCRTPAIMADAAHAILCRQAPECSGNFFIDDAVLAEEGCQDFDVYAVDPSQALAPDFFLDEGIPFFGKDGS
jgi:citronellol/citronellal dehydrogenase